MSDSNVEIRFKKTNDLAKLPTKANDSDTGFDVYATESKTIPARSSNVVDVGLEFAYITPGYWVKVEGRSGLGFKHSIIPHAGIIDNAYRGNAGIKLFNHSDDDYRVSEGDRIAQFVVYKNYDVTIEEGEIEEASRGANGFGSTGR